MNVLKENIETLMNEKGITQVELANLSGISYDSVNKIMTCSRESLATSSIDSIAKALNTSFEFLVSDNKKLEREYQYIFQLFQEIPQKKHHAIVNAVKMLIKFSNDIKE